MENLFESFTLGTKKLMNRFVFPPIKLGYGLPDGTVTDRQLRFYQQIAENGPALMILEPAAVTIEGKEHPKQLCVHLPESTKELKKITDVIHQENRLACLHLNHAGAAANPMVTKTDPRAPSPITCQSSGKTSVALNEKEIETIIAGYGSAAQKAGEAGFDMIEVQAGHGYLISQFLNKKINKRDDVYGLDRLLLATKVLSTVKNKAGGLPFLVRISGNEMSPEFGLEQDDLFPFLKLAEEAGACAVHVGMGSNCFSPPWYFHHGSLPDKPQLDALARVREQTSLPLIVAGRMGRKEKVLKIIKNNLADLIALGRPLIADPLLVEKWQNGEDIKKIRYCGYCLQGCLHRLKSGEPLGCNLNPEIGLPPLRTTDNPLKVLVAGGGPGGMSAAMYLSQRGHQVTLAEMKNHLGGQFALAWQAPGKETMKEGLEAMEHAIKTNGVNLLMETMIDPAIVKEIHPDLLVWATGAVQNIPDIQGLDSQYTLTSLEFFEGEKEIHGPRVLVIGAGRVGLEIAEKLGRQGYDVVATKRTDPIGSMMEMITKNLALKRIGEMKNIILMPHTTVKAFMEKTVDIEQDGAAMSLEPFNTVILASGMLPAPGPAKEIQETVQGLEIIGDAHDVRDIFSAIQAGYQLALSY